MHVTIWWLFLLEALNLSWSWVHQAIAFAIASEFCRKLGNGRNTFTRVLFRKRELTEFCGKLGEFCDKLGEVYLWHTNNRLRGTHWALSLELGESDKKTHWVRCLKPCSPKPYSASFRETSIRKEFPQRGRIFPTFIRKTVRIRFANSFAELGCYSLPWPFFFLVFFVDFLAFLFSLLLLAFFCAFSFL